MATITTTDAAGEQRDQGEQIARLMTRMARGEQAAVFELYDQFGARLCAVMRRHLDAVGVRQVTRDDLDGLVIDACLELASCAGAWRPDGGALPWTWAAPRLRTLAARHAGLHADELDEAALAQLAGAEPVRSGGDHRGAEGSAGDLLAEAAAHHPLAALLLDALAVVGTPRDRDIVLELRLQAHLGDPSPSRTVAGSVGASPEAVRQVGSRLRRRLRTLAEDDPRFAPLADLPLVA